MPAPPTVMLLPGMACVLPAAGLLCPGACFFAPSSSPPPGGRCKREASRSAAVWGAMVRPEDGQVSEAKGIPTALASFLDVSISVYTGAAVRLRLALARRLLDGRPVERPRTVEDTGPSMSLGGIATLSAS